MAIRILIADDHQLVRAGLAMLIAEIPGYEVVEQASDGQEALAKAEELKPDLILLDIQMPRLSGLDALPQIRAMAPTTRVLMLSMHANEEHLQRALELGALGYLLKDSTPSELELALKTVISGNVWLSAMISPHVRNRATPSRHTADQDNVLTPRQQSVLKRLAEGASVKEIAFELDLSAKTVETYRAQLMERLALSDLAALVRYAIRNGIVKL
jgi:DNA-binding NarL/FixJ family response regulator